MALVIINPETPEDIQKALSDLGHIPVKIPLCHDVASPLKGHPDLQICFIQNYAIHNPLLPEDFLAVLKPHVSLIKGKSLLQETYPDDIPYNVIITKYGALHLQSKTDSSIKDILKVLSIPLFNIKQGYGKCSTAIVNENSIITSDAGIHQKALSISLHSLLIEQGHIVLPGYKYGFIGGATGCDSETFYASGTLEDHPDYKKILAFLAQCNMKYIELSKNRAIDLGSFFFIKESLL